VKRLIKSLRGRLIDRTYIQGRSSGVGYGSTLEWPILPPTNQPDEGFFALRRKAVSGITQISETAAMKQDISDDIQAGDT
jgi:hypothetical protein